MDEYSIILTSVLAITALLTYRFRLISRKEDKEIDEEKNKIKPLTLYFSNDMNTSWDIKTGEEKVRFYQSFVNDNENNITIKDIFWTLEYSSPRQCWDIKICHETNKIAKDFLNKKLEYSDSLDFEIDPSKIFDTRWSYYPVSNWEKLECIYNLRVYVKTTTGCYYTKRIGNAALDYLASTHVQNKFYRIVGKLFMENNNEIKQNYN